MPALVSAVEKKKRELFISQECRFECSVVVSNK